MTVVGASAVEPVVEAEGADPQPPSDRTEPLRRLLPPLTVALCSALLFLVEPLSAKLLLPIFGGTASVWTGSVLFFQVVLLLGYGCVHAGLRIPADRRGVVARLAATGVLLALPLLVLPLHVPDWAAPGDRPALPWLLLVLIVLVGLPFLALSVVGPLVSSWSASALSTSDGSPSAGSASIGTRSPYRLYAASNAGALGGLLAYPVLGEPLLGAGSLRTVWSVGYVVAALLLVVCALLTVRRTGPRPAAAETVPVVEDAGDRTSRRRERLGWLALSALPVSLMLGTTTVLTTDVSPVPLLWVVPLALYLGTLAIAFAPTREGARPAAGQAEEPVRIAAPGLVALLALAGVSATTALQVPKLVQVVLDLTVLFVVCLAAHRRLADRRPAPRRLTEYYLFVAIGGALGGAANSLLAPLIFVRISEFPLALLAAVGLLVMTGRAARPMSPRMSPLRTAGIELGAIAVPLVFLLLARADGARTPLDVGIAVALFAVAWLVGARRPQPVALGVAGILLLTCYPLPPPLQAGRNFYGSYAVADDAGRRVFTEGTTVHGWQYLDDARRTVPTAYYARGGPIGAVMSAYGSDPALRSVGVVGLGVGTLAAYGEPGRSMRFFELDPQVVGVAKDPALFTYLRESRGVTSTVTGDGRLQMRSQPDASFGLLVLDAFSSDAIPTHLLTREAFAEWLRVLQPGGLLAVHITNRFVDLAPVLAGAARQHGLSAAIREDRHPSDAAASPSRWVVLSRRADRLDPLLSLPGWRPLPTKRVVNWTDDSSSLLPILHG